MHTVPEWLQTAFADWITHRLYVDGSGNYRSYALGRRIVAYNRALKRAYPRNDEFRRAAHHWLSLWEVVPTARLTGFGRIHRDGSKVRR
jgi:hypothetical protein